MISMTRSEKYGKLRSFLTDPASLFVVEIFMIYGIWKLSHHFLLQTDWWKKLVFYIGGFYADITNSILHVFGEHTYYHGISITFLDGLQRTLRVEEHCLAIPATIIFVSSIALFGGSVKNKMWFIPLGIFCIFLINTIRLVLLSYIFENFPETFFRVNHSFVYVVLTYSFIFLMIAWWMNSYNKPRNTPQADNNG